MADLPSHIQINPRVRIAVSEIEFHPIRASGPGGQNVNKVSSAIHLRFDVKASSLPSGYKARILSYSDQRISHEGIIIIKAQNARSQARNKEIALERLAEFLRKILTPKKRRIPTRRTYGSNERRLKKKSGRSQIKANRGKVRLD